MRKKKPARARPGRSLAGKILMASGYFAAVLGLLVLGWVGLAWFDTGEVRLQESAVPPSLIVEDRFGNILGRRLSPKGLWYRQVNLDSVSPWMVLATLSAEDQRFYLHPGVDAQAILRALWQNFRAGRVVSGASTLTQQLVKALRPHPRTLWGKTQEALGALGLERNAAKAKILESYLNTVSYGNNAKGVEAAAWSYFGVSSRDLTLAQSAFLAAIPKSPTRYNPLRFPQRVRLRQAVLLNQMRYRGWIDEKTCQMALHEQVEFLDPRLEEEAPHFVQQVADCFEGRRERVRTTLDGRLQGAVQRLILSRLKVLVRQNVSNGAVVVLDNRSGEILAWAGSRDFFDARSQGQVDGVLSRRQPGSALKPFLFGLWFERGGSPSDWIEDAPFTAADGYTPRNYDEKFHGWMTLRTALGCSYNVPVIRLAQRFKNGEFLDFLHEAGFSSLTRTADFYGSGLALGNGEVSLLELTSAYSMLARGGLGLPATWLPAKGRVKPWRVLSEDSAYLVTNILCDPVARTPSFGMHSLLRLPFDFGAKTGTSKDYRDNWAVGYTPEWTVGVWVGNFNGKPMEGVSGVTGAGGLLHDVALTVYKFYPASDFKVPEGIVTRAVCPDSGDLASGHCPDSILEVFASGHEPQETCQHGSGRLRGVDPNPPLRIVSPRNGDVFKMDSSLSAETQAIPFTCNRDPDPSVFQWTLDGKQVDWDGNGFWWKLQAGKHVLALKEKALETEQTSKAQVVHFTVLK